MYTIKGHNKLVYTIKDRCRVCYTCVRECPVKAIKIINGQAEVMNERCIACGNCTKVCSQGAKAYLKTKEYVKEVLSSDLKKIAIIAPSFPAEFTEIDDYRMVVGMIRALGFNIVSEVSFGADLVAKEYKKLFSSESDINYITSDCPAIVACVEQHYPDSVKNLAPIVSPMVATARVMKKIHGKNARIIFFGPCIAKKSESDEVDTVLTFRELRELIKEYGIQPASVKLSDFDPPKGGRGSIFPLTRGLAQNTGIEDNFINGNIIVAEGRTDFQEAIKEFESGALENQHLELLCCEGCILGPGISNNEKKYERIKKVSNYVKQKLSNFNEEEWLQFLDKFSDISLITTFEKRDQRQKAPLKSEIDAILQSMGKFDITDHLDCGACGYDSCRNHAIAILNGLAETEMCLPYTIEKLHHSVNDLAISNEKLVSVQQALKQSEKLAHMGQLSAGIAHELNNPLGVIIMYSNLLLDECPPESPIASDLQLIAEQSNRCKKIVGGLLNFARKNQVNYDEIFINDLIKQSISSVIIPENIEYQYFPPKENCCIEVDIEQMTQVITNLAKNAIEAMPNGGKLTIKAICDQEYIHISIEDSGTGIPKEEIDKIFEPFYTTKGIGKGTGLGLATTYGILKMHKGKINVESNANPDEGSTGTTFHLHIPINKLL